MTVKADNKEAYIGGRLPEFTYTVEGLLGGDTLITVPALTTDAGMNKSGTFNIIPGGADAGGNYNVIYINGTLTVKDYPYIPISTMLSSYVTTPNNISGGKVSASKKLACTGDIVTMTVSPDPGYVLIGLTVTDSLGNIIAVTEADGKYCFKMPGYGVNIDAEFAKIDTPCPGDSTCPMYHYTDLDQNEWYHDGVHYCIENGLMQGVDESQFNPDGTTTRAMIVTILWRLEGSPVLKYRMNFDDVDADRWYTEAIRWAKSKMIIEGYGDGRFGTNDSITREQLATILYRYAQSKGGGFTGAWKDNINNVDLSNVSDWAYEAMCWMHINAIITGKPGRVLDPKGNATRAEAAVMLQRYCEAMAKED